MKRNKTEFAVPQSSISLLAITTSMTYTESSNNSQSQIDNHVSSCVVIRVKLGKAKRKPRRKPWLFLCPKGERENAMEGYCYENMETGELLTYKEMHKQFVDEYGGDDYMDVCGWRKYYTQKKNTTMNVLELIEFYMDEFGMSEDDANDMALLESNPDAYFDSIAEEGRR